MASWPALFYTYEAEKSEVTDMWDRDEKAFKPGTGMYVSVNGKVETAGDSFQSCLYPCSSCSQLFIGLSPFGFCHFLPFLISGFSLASFLCYLIRFVGFLFCWILCCFSLDLLKLTFCFYFLPFFCLNFNILDSPHFRDSKCLIKICIMKDVMLLL